MEKEDDDDDEVPLDSSCMTALWLWYDITIAPVDNLLEGSKIIVFPERESCTGYRFKLWRTRMEIICQRHQYKSRVVPSVTTLKLIHDSPMD